MESLLRYAGSSDEEDNVECRTSVLSSSPRESSQLHIPSSTPVPIAFKSLPPPKRVKRHRLLLDANNDDDPMKVVNSANAQVSLLDKAPDNTRSEDSQSLNKQEPKSKEQCPALLMGDTQGPAPPELPVMPPAPSLDILFRGRVVRPLLD